MIRQETHRGRKLSELFGPKITVDGLLQQAGLNELDYFAPTDTAYLAPPWGTATYEECKGFLREVRAASFKLTDVYFEALRLDDEVKLAQLAEALEAVFASTIFGSNALEGVGLPEEETLRVCKAYVRGEFDERDDECLSDETKQRRREVLNHVKAFLFLLEKLKENGQLEEENLPTAHGLLVSGDEESVQHGQYRTTYCVVEAALYDRHGDEITTAQPEKIEASMKIWLEKYNLALRTGLKNQEPISRSAVLIKEFLEIHPFQDGNGRMSRILENVLVSTRYPFILLPHDAGAKRYRKNYMQTVRAAIRKDRSQFLAYRSLRNALNAARILTENLCHIILLSPQGSACEDIDHGEERENGKEPKLNNRASSSA